MPRILADYGLPAADTGGADGFVSGYLIADPGTARAALEPLVDLFGLAVFQRAGTLVFARAQQTVTFRIPTPDPQVVPGTLVGLPERLGAATFLVTEIEDGSVRRVSARQITAAAPAIGRVPAPAAARASEVPVVGRPLALFLDLPMLPGSAAPEDAFRVALWNRNWRTQLAYASPEASGYGLRATVSRRATVGQLSAALPPGREGVFDRHGKLAVSLYSGELAGVRPLQLLNGANLAALRSANGDWELVEFGSAAEIAPSEWLLTTLLRGQLGTHGAMQAGAPQGADFVLIDQAVVPAGLKREECGLPLSWRTGPAGFDFSDLYYGEQQAVGGLTAQRHGEHDRLGAARPAGYRRRSRRRPAARCGRRNVCADAGGRRRIGAPPPDRDRAELHLWRRCIRRRFRRPSGRRRRGGRPGRGGRNRRARGRAALQFLEQFTSSKGDDDGRPQTLVPVAHHLGFRTRRGERHRPARRAAGARLERPGTGRLAGPGGDRGGERRGDCRAAVGDQPDQPRRQRLTRPERPLAGALNCGFTMFIQALGWA